ncbi:MAG: arsenite efflux MFS transporter ArsK [Alphaproteobacteria bacterium]|nr:arsenite efflux MFS transporter ArsK [Alphaproteobacteria bacterium]MBU0804107.1 arsenite efflux MFS transporter ArsK [Alphaproteobacteria bacterium]MBU0872596.1 arsenite efflux MFS transporter ArsK [Alphaproteobacteria bacterium]MBU1403608.1 arsenite efflux MFS transporter ArsK [Alphaproteobacteria bacterium]MBU1593635.1 arsenite efflux MFS transporter ArsK [Alphaproteobacteria bacterium]
MHSPDVRAPALAVWALGVTQIIGYGTLFYSFAILAPAMSADLDLPEQWVFAALSLALFLGSLLAPTAGRMADRHGAGRVMTVGSAAAALALAACALAPERFSFIAALVAMELASCFVLYATAFVAIVQIGPVGAQRSITHLTLIAGFASTIFWPVTTWLHGFLDWRAVYFVFAGLNLIVCLPIHAWLLGLSRRRQMLAPGLPASAPALAQAAPLDPAQTRIVFLLMMAGFAIGGLVLSSILIHMVPLLTAIGLGTAGTLAATLFGPSQVASRLINMLFGGRLSQALLAVIATLLLAVGLAVLLATAPSLPGIAAFVVLFGLGSGLVSIVGGTLPLEMFGRRGYGSRVGWMSAARQFSSSFAPFLFALMMARTSVPVSIGALWIVAVLGVAVFTAICVAARGRPAEAEAA